jgi:protein involved in polysaccharide export with SLBB domain/glycosyltransferase involved in cell wall biosynthesis
MRTYPMTQPPKFSVVIPAYNMAPYIESCLESVFAQTDPDFEVLVVDDGSTDRTAELVKGFTDRRLRLIPQANGGLAAARNTGVRHAQGELVAFLDADDRWRPGKLAAHRQALDQDPEASVSYDWSIFINAQGEVTNLAMVQSRIALTHEALMLKNYLGNGSTSVVRRSVLEAVGSFEERLKRFVDQELWVRLAFQGHRFHLVPEVLTEYRVHPNSFTADTDRMLRGLEDFLTQIRTYAPQSVERFGPLARACTHRWMARAQFVAGNYPKARFHGRQALAHDFTVLWRDPRAPITLGALLVQALTPAPLFQKLLGLGQKLIQARITAIVLLGLVFFGLPVGAGTEPATPSANFVLSASAGDSYLLGAGDRIRVTVYGYEEMSGEQVVLADGRINLPFLGAFKVEGLPIDDARQQLAERLAPYINRPQVGLAVLNPRPLRVSVVGQVNQPGPQVFVPSNVGTTPALMTLSKALISAGGITPVADLTNIELHRYRADGTVAIAHLDLWNNLTTQVDFVDPVLQDRDTILVGTLKPGSTQNPQISLRSTLAPDRISIAVGGEVLKPGTISVQASQTALDALIAAGGPNDSADLGNITLLRQQEGKMVVRTLNLNAARQGDLAQNPVLMVGDSLLVPRSGWKSFINDTVDGVLRPFSSLAQLLFFITRL